MRTIHRLLATWLWKHTGYHNSPFVCLHGSLAIYEGDGHYTFTEFCGKTDNPMKGKYRIICPDCHRIVMYPGWSDE